MYKRIFKPPNHHYFLFGPRSTGKSTWLRQAYPDALVFNLLKTSEYLSLAQNPDEFRARVEASNTSVIVIDEIQRLPTLLNEVHDLISISGKKRRFVLTGSSARKLRRAGVNLLAGRAVTRAFFPLVSEEFGFREKDIDNILSYGNLPDIRGQHDESLQLEILESYADTYLRQEIKEEALVKNLEPFSRFLKVAAIMNGQTLNLSNLAREAEVKRPTVEGYFDILVDTLLAFKLPAWQPRAKVKELTAPKFYFFDCGVARVLAGRHASPLERVERGFLLETFLINEIRAYVSYRCKKGSLFYWGNPSESEVDLIYDQPRSGSVGFEFKTTSRWRREDHRTLQDLSSTGFLKKGYGVYLGKEQLKFGSIQILPITKFLQLLWNDKVIR